MKQLIVLFVVGLVACGGAPKKKEEPLIEATEASASCCCRIESDNPDDPTFTSVAVMECSVRHGVCLKTTAQCEAQPGGTEEPGPDSGSLPPTVEESPTSF
jgi:hypothetical protein